MAAEVDVEVEVEGVSLTDEDRPNQPEGDFPNVLFGFRREPPCGSYRPPIIPAGATSNSPRRRSIPAPIKLKSRGSTLRPFSTLDVHGGGTPVLAWEPVMRTPTATSRTHSRIVCMSHCPRRSSITVEACKEVVRDW